MLRYLVLLAVLFPATYALSCADIPIEQRIDDGAVVFTGRLVEQQVDGQGSLLAFTVHASFAGDVGQRAIVHQQCWMDCEELPLDEYFVVAWKEEDELQVGMCDGPVQVQNAADDLQAAAAYGGAKPPTQDSGEETALAPVKKKPTLWWIAFLAVALIVLWRWKPTPREI